MFADTVPYTELGQLQNSDEYYNYGELGAAYLGFNTTRSPMDDPRVRKALSLAINRDYICKWVTMNGDTAATALICDGIADADPYVEFRAAGNSYFGASGYKKQMKEAKELLAQAGYPGGKGLPTLTYLTLNGAKEVAVANAIAAMWKENLGVECSVVAGTDVEFNDKKIQQGYDVINDRYVDTFNDPAVILQRFESGHVQNVSLYQSEDYDALLALAKETEDKKDRYRLYHRAEELLMTDAAVCPIYFLHYENYVKRNGVDGFYITPTGYKFFMYVKNQSEDVSSVVSLPEHETSVSAAS